MRKRRNNPAQETPSLRNAPLEGRLDVLAYKAAEHVGRVVESKYGLAGLWDGLAPIVEHEIQVNVPKTVVDVPLALKGLFLFMDLKHRNRMQQPQPQQPQEPQCR